MSVGLKFISAVFKNTADFPDFSVKVNEQWFDADCRKIWNFITKFYSQYGVLPTVNEVSENTGFILVDAPEPLQYYYDRLIEKNLTEDMTEVILEAERLKLNGESVKAFERLTSFVEQKRSLIHGDSDSQDISEAKPLILERYMKSKEGFVGIPAPFPKMTSMTGGWCAGDLTYVVARQGVGKSWLSILMAHRAKKHGAKVLYISGEMNSEDIGSRYFAVSQSFPYAGLRKGNLNPLDEERFFNFMKKEHGVEFDIVEAGSGFRVADLERFLIKGYDLLIIDAVYRLRSTLHTKDRFENLAQVTIECKTLALKYRIPVVCTSQLNREAVKSKDPGLESIGMSDVIGMEAANIFGLLRVKNNKNIMKIKPMKIREGELIDEHIYVNWDFRRMNFEETHWNEDDRAGDSLQDRSDYF